MGRVLRGANVAGVCGLVIAGGLASAAGAAETIPHSLEPWNNEARLSLPIWLVAWLGLLLVTFLASFFFARAHVAARITAAGFIVSHVLVIAIESTGVLPLTKGLVSVTHAIGWTAPLFVLAKEIGRTEAGTRYGWWCRQMLFIIAVSLVFDYRDAGMYLYYRLVGHPAL